MDENLPAEWDQFFANGGELPETLAQLQTPDIAADPPAEVPVAKPDVVVDEGTGTATPQPAQQASSPAYDRLIELSTRQMEAMQRELAELKTAQTKAAEPAPPDPAIDPLGSMMHQMKQIKAEIDAIRAHTQQSTEQQQQTNQMNAFLNAVDTSVAQFKTTNPDYDAAYKHLVDMRTADFTDRGMTAAQAREAVGREEMDIAAKALQAGKNPAEIAYNMAKRYGYKAKVEVVTPENKLDTIKKGLQAGKEVEAAATPEKITLTNLREAKDEDLQKMVENDWEGIFGKRKGIFG